MAGIKKSHIRTTLQIERLAKDLSKSILSIDINDADQITLFDGDSVELYAVEPEFTSVKKVSITGEVNVPGTYAVNDSTKLSDVIEMAGGYTNNAYPLGGVLSRESVKLLENQSKDKGYDELLRYLVASPGFGQMGGAGSEGIITFLSLLKDYNPTGRIVAEFELSELKRSPSSNRFLEDGDSIHIPTYSSDVYVFGEVMSAGPIPFQEKNSAMDYINSSGSFSRVADTDRIILITPDGRPSLVAAGLFSKFNEDQILPGSVIYIPRQIGKVDGINLAATLSPIISSFALSIASLNSINN
jgi:protein involved in polysaccharide export with SLBB domain